MKIQITDAPFAPNVLRRKLLLGLPGGLALATPLALLGCGGSSDSATSDGTGEAPSVDVSSVPMGGDTGNAATPTQVTVQWPSGAARPAGTMRIASALGSSDLSGDAGQVDILGGGPDLVTLYSADGKALLTGFVGTGAASLSPSSTAGVLLHYALGLNFASAASTAAMQAYIAATPQATALAAAIASLLASDPAALHSVPKALTDAIAAARNGLATAASAAGRQRALGLTVQPIIPTGQLANTIGLSVEQGSEPNSVFVRNEGMRRAVFEIRQEGWYDDQGAFHSDQKIVAADEVPLPKSFDSFGGTLAGWAESYWGGASAWGGEGEFFQSQTELQTLPLAPDSAKKTKYTVFVFTPGISQLPAGEYARLHTEELAYIRGGDLSKNLHWRVLLEDFAVPFLLGLLSGAAKDEVKGAYKDLVAGLVDTVGAFVKDRMPDIASQLGEGKMSSWDAFVQFAKALTIDPVTLEMSPALQALLALVVKVIAIKLKGETGRALYRVVQSGGKRGAAIFPVMRILEAVDGFLGGASKARLVHDSVVPYEFFAWEVMATKIKVVLKPNPLEVETTGVTYPVTVEIVDNDDDEYGNEKGSISFDWDCTGLYGSLYSRVDAELAKPNHFTTSTVNATANYLPSGKDADAANPETITVQAFFEPIGSGGIRTLIGSATTALKFKKPFTLSITPAKMDLPVDEHLSLVASIVETLPPTASVRYEWRLRSGGGDLNVSGADAAAGTQHSQVDYTAPGSETTAVIEVIGIVTRDPALPPFRTDPVTSTVSVKKGLKQIVMEVGGGVFSCYDTKACGVTEYTAFIVPRLASAQSYTAVLSGYAYPSCNRSVTWSTTKGDGGGCNFPVSYHPHTSAGATNLWAVWIGFGGPFSGKCVVTITLKP